MDIINHKTCCLLVLKKLSSIDLLLDFLNQDASNPQNLIIDLQRSSIETSILIKNLYPFYINWQKRNKSFILVSNIKKESLKDMISIASLEEAFDFFYMEELTRII